MSIPWNPELLDVCAGDPWKVLMLQQLCYWETRTKDPLAAVHKSAREFLNELDAHEHLTERSVQRKIQELEECGALQSETVSRFTRKKAYRVNRSLNAIDSACERVRGVSWLTHTDADVASKRQPRRIEATQMSFTTDADVASLGTETTTKTTAETTERSARMHAHSVDLLRVFHEPPVGRMETTVQQCDTILNAADRADWSFSRVVDELLTIQSRCKRAPAYKLTKMMLTNIAEVAPPNPVQPGSRPAKEYEHDERTDDQVAEEAGEILVGKWCEYLRSTWTGDLKFSAKYEGFDDVDLWLRSNAILALRVDGIVAPPELP